MSEEILDRQIVELLEACSFILDIGCGDGRLVNALVSRHGRRVIGLDVSDHGFAEAKEFASQEAQHHLVECVECDAGQIAFQDAYFEAVILRFSLHHIEETQPALIEIQRILIPGGILLIGEWLVKDEDQPRDGCFRFTLDDMRHMLREADFRKFEFETFAEESVLVKALK